MKKCAMPVARSPRPIVLLDASVPTVRVSGRPMPRAEPARDRPASPCRMMGHRMAGRPRRYLRTRSHIPQQKTMMAAVPAR